MHIAIDVLVVEHVHIVATFAGQTGEKHSRRGSGCAGQQGWRVVDVHEINVVRGQAASRGKISRCVWHAGSCAIGVLRIAEPVETIAVGSLASAVRAEIVDRSCSRQCALIRWHTLIIHVQIFRTAIG